MIPAQGFSGAGGGAAEPGPRPGDVVPPHRLRSECYRDPLKGSSANTLGTDEVVRSREAGRLLKTQESPYGEKR